MPPSMVQAGLDHYANATERLYLRSKAEIERFFDGLELVPPYDGAKPGRDLRGPVGGRGR